MKLTAPPFQLQLNSYTLIGAMMAITGALYPFYSSDTVPTALVDMLTMRGYLLWCVVMVIAGLGMVFKPSIVWVLPMVVFVVATMTLAIRQVSLTAPIYYLILPIFLLFHHFDPSPLMESRRWWWRVLARSRWHGWLALLNAAMLVVLMTNPDGAGMGLFYGAFGLILPDLLDPVWIMRGVYVIALGTLIVVINPNRVIVQLASVPLMVHGLTFLFVVVSLSKAWAFAPFFILNPALLWIAAGRYDYAA